MLVVNFANKLQAKLASICQNQLKQTNWSYISQNSIRSTWLQIEKEASHIKFSAHESMKLNQHQVIKDKHPAMQLSQEKKIAPSHMKVKCMFNTYYKLNQSKSYPSSRASSHWILKAKSSKFKNTNNNKIKLKF